MNPKKPKSTYRLPTDEEINKIVGLAQINSPTNEIAALMLLSETLIQDWLSQGRAGKHPRLTDLAQKFDQASAYLITTCRQTLSKGAASDPKLAEILLKSIERRERDKANRNLIPIKGPLKNQVYEKFAQLIAAGTTDTEAYKQTHPNSSRDSARKNAPRLTANEDIKARVIELQARTASATTLSVTERREIAAEIARRTDLDPAIAAVRLRATEVEAKHAGEFLDRADLTTNGEALPNALPPIVITPPGGSYERRSK